MENFINRIRPKEEIRDRIDIAYKIEKQSIIIFEIRSSLRDPMLKIEHPIAKTVHVKSKNQWKIYWMKRDLKWHPYDPEPVVKTLKKFLKIVTEDEKGCFWG
ncbi:DUF3024 domain-containing protein [candidate division WOR-3 bacterium]|nr:DUF3024 domain-containing protein [candidate division WOR-3 bacterium]